MIYEHTDNVENITLIDTEKIWSKNQIAETICIQGC